MPGLGRIASLDACICRQAAACSTTPTQHGKTCPTDMHGLNHLRGICAMLVGQPDPCLRSAWLGGSPPICLGRGCPRSTFQLPVLFPHVHLCIVILPHFACNLVTTQIKRLEIDASYLQLLRRQAATREGQQRTGRHRPQSVGSRGHFCWAETAPSQWCSSRCSSRTSPARGTAGGV